MTGVTADGLIRDGWGYHDSDTERLAGELESLPLAEVTNDQAGPLLKLANHALGEHLGDWARARSIAEAVCAEGRPGRQSVQACAALAAARFMTGQTAPAQAAEILTMQAAGAEPLAGYLETKAALVAALSGSGRLEDALAVYDGLIELRDAVPGALSSDRALAIASNNLAGLLLALEARTPAQARTLERCADAALTLWTRCGTWENEERALYLVALVANAAGRWQSALDAAAKALAVIGDCGPEPVDEAFIHLAAAHGHVGLGNTDRARESAQAADALAQGWEDPGLKDWYAAERSRLPVQT